MTKQTKQSTSSSPATTTESRWTSRLLPWVAIGLVIRVIIILYAEWHDAHFIVKYTDIDYFVYSDAARFMWHGQSPFERATFRYTPLLSWLLQPNVFIHKSFGKFLFAVVDIVVALLIYSLVRMRSRKENTKTAAYCAAMYLLNPIVVNVSTRGNADAIVAMTVCLVLYCLYKKRYILAAVCYGLAVHVKIYPIIFSLPLVFMLNDDYFGRRDKSSAKKKKEGLVSSAIKGLKSLFSKERLLFTVISAGTFFALTGYYYYLYGFHFLYETYLYHFVRSDNRHNFSVYFYQIYLNNSPGTSAAVVARLSPQLIGILAFVPQFLVLGTLAACYYTDIAFCVFVQTLAFVAFNKVCTVQYFVWYLSLLPLVLPSTTIAWKRGLFMLLTWFAGQGLWLANAYKLEFLGENTFMPVWLAGIVFFCVNIYILLEFLYQYKYKPTAPLEQRKQQGHRLFIDGKINQIY